MRTNGGKGGKRKTGREVCLYLTINELKVVGALGIAVTSSISSSGLVVGVLGCTTISIHLHEVEGAVESAGQVADINIEGELLVLQLEDLVLVLAGQEVQAGANVGGIRTVGDKPAIALAPAQGRRGVERTKYE